ncbi:CAAX protease self-immunity family protein [Chlamydia ibidis]|uniref:CAAX protease self-immunity family protein n=2 Tax=Chlamydia ibidis TaxID=1405396 RepID=S7KHG6_9CHLA|nr:type II CAAX endopeptidase family protein [Chlamydia ibidis]EPP35616.1 CAAX protease self-immunity family protein [Chlamydia ibidis]EQM62647.1 CAAX amino terminal protease self- immunity family protein [Chlamydia ibidis 10-1398/6]
MLHSWLFFLILIVLALCASRRFFVWPCPNDKTPIELVHVLAGASLFLFASLGLSFMPAYSDITLCSLHGIFLATAFLFYLLGLPISVTRGVLYSGEKTPTTIVRCLFPAVRMWIIVVALTQIFGAILNKLVGAFVSSDLLEAQHLTQEVQQDLPAAYNVAFIFSVGLLIPFAEEVFFRGFLQTFLKNKMRRKYALLYTSVIFALSHVERSLGSLVFVPLLFIFSLCAGFLYEKERHIAAPLILHTLFNMTNIGMLSLQTA